MFYAFMGEREKSLSAHKNYRFGCECQTMLEGSENKMNQREREREGEKNEWNAYWSDWVRS